MKALETFLVGALIVIAVGMIFVDSKNASDIINALSGGVSDIFTSLRGNPTSETA